MVDNAKSSLRNIRCGVPQGSILGPLLFLIYVNDMWRAVPNSAIKLFADDTNMFLSGENLKSLYESTNKELEKLAKWVFTNKLSINYEKTCYTIFKPGGKGASNDANDMTIKIRGIVISGVHTCKYLGMVLDDQLLWKLHIDHVYKKIIKFTCLFYKLREIVPAGILRKIYFALVYPHINYGIELYANTHPTYLDHLIKLNNKILRIVQRRKMDTAVSLLYKSFNLMQIPQLFKFNVSVLVYKVLNYSEALPSVYKNYFVANSTIHEHNTRHSAALHKKTVNTSYGFRTVREHGTRIWNDIPAEIQNIPSLSSFKRMLKKHYINSI